MSEQETHDFTIETLGEAKNPTPIVFSRTLGDSIANYVQEDEYILNNVRFTPGQACEPLPKSKLLEIAGPRDRIYFNPGHVHAGIVTCGGLCPGLNDMIRAITRCLWHRYGVRRISGIQNGYRGFFPEHQLPTIDLDPDVVDDIHKMGGSVLGTSRGGGERTSELVDAIERMNLNMLFTIGGDGTQKGAMKIAREIRRRGLKIAVVGIPKTIDNDFSFIQKSFGFETAVSRAADAVSSAHTEAHSTIHGIGLVKLMGRESGFIAAHTALATHEANFVLIPEVPFDLEGENGLFYHLKKRLERRNHAVIIVAEGAGQHFFEGEEAKDASGNLKLQDIGNYLKERITGFFSREQMEINLKYIDPSYMIRSSPADPNDSYFCARLGNNACHAAMSGRTNMLISLVNNHYVHVPIEVV
ncbi:MAG: ATP-dependent 6-phosphofructokinase, partial [Spirochaetales bacterium]|nr:ATP-dependent 6-phosphofructokinase [Spirochaetales bacterium]MCF7939179.1 ATP-dependent 6-phosphofructokinase [Spirochaetales bacterium]